MDKEIIKRPKWLTPFLVVLLCILVFVGTGCVSTYYFNKAHNDETEALNEQIGKLENQVKQLEKTNKTTPITQTEVKTTTETVADPTEAWQTVNDTKANVTFKYPSTWAIKTDPEDMTNIGVISSYRINYDDKTKTDDGYIEFYDMETWKNHEPGSDEGYAVPKADRLKLASELTTIYNAQKISADDIASLREQGLGFMGYATGDQSAITYVASKDGLWRGFSFYNAQGQDVGVGPWYHVDLYNATSSKLITVNYSLCDRVQYSEIKAMNDVILAEKNIDQQANISKQKQAEFRSLVETSPREKLSWATVINNVDLSAKSVISK